MARPPKSWLLGLALLSPIIAFLIHLALRTHALALNFQEGALVQYRIDLESEGRQTSLQGGASLHEVKTKLQGLMQWRIAAKTADGYRVQGTLHIQSLDEASRSLFQLAEGAIPFEFHLSSRSAITRIQFRRQNFASEAVLIVDILRQFEMSLPAQPLRFWENWTHKDTYADHEVPATLCLTWPWGKAFEIRKSWTSTPDFQAEGQGLYTWNRTDGLQTISVERRLLQSVMGQFQIHNHLKFQAQRETAEPRFELKTFVATDSLLVEDLGLSTTTTLARERRDHKLVGSMKIEQVLDGLKKLSSDPKTNMDFYQRLKAFIALNPDQLKPLLEFLNENPPQSETFKLITTALTAAGHEEAQKILREAIEASDDSEKRSRLIPNLTFCQHPSEETEDFVRGLTEDADTTVAGTARLGLGTIAHRLRDKDPVRSHKIFEEYRQKLSQTQSEHETHAALSVIGNIGDPSTLVAVQPYLRATQAKTRAKAYESLRHVKVPEAEEQLIAAVKSDKDTLVREVASESLLYDPIEASSMEAIEQQLKTETNIQVIKNLARTLANNAQNSPRARTILENYAQRCGHPDLCSFLSGIVKSFNSQSGEHNG